MEQELGYALFVRLKQHIYPTPYGTALYSKMQPFVQAFMRLQNRMKRFGSTQTIVLAKNIQASALLVKPINQFRIQHPDIIIKPLPSSSSRNSQLLQEGKADLAFGNLEHFNPRIENSRFLFDEEHQYCTNAQGPYANCHKVTFPLIVDRPLAVMRAGYDRHSQINKGFQRYNLKPNIILYAEEVHSLIELAKAGIADTFLLSKIIKDNPPLKGISLTPVRYMHFGFWWRKDHHLTQAENVFMDFIDREMNCKGYRDENSANDLFSNDL